MRWARDMSFESREPVLYIRRVADLAHLAVAYDVDADLDLSAHDVVDGRADRIVENRGVVAFALLFL